MKRLSIRVCLTGVSLLLCIASVAWIAGQSMILLAKLPTPLGEFSVRADPQGWLLYRNSQNSTDRPTVIVCAFDEIRNFRQWSEILRGANADYSIWLTNALFFAAWDSMRVLGLKHYLVVPLLALNTIILMAWYRRLAAAEESAGATAHAHVTQSSGQATPLPTTTSSDA